jgi:hypothetical protein
MGLFVKRMGEVFIPPCHLYEKLYQCYSVLSRKKGCFMMDRVTILQAIQELPQEEQEELISELIDRFASMKEPPLTPHTSRLAGIFHNGKTPPTDEEIAQWLDERRLEKYGQNCHLLID